MKDLTPYVSLIQSQHGLVSREQLMRAGANRGLINRALTSNRFERLLPGVYRLTGAPTTAFTPFMVAALWAGAEACISHRSAGWLHHFDGLDRRSPTVVDVILPYGRTLAAPASIRVHWSRTFVPRRDIAFAHNIPCTTVARTLIDLAADLDLGNLEQAVDGALRYRPNVRSWTLSLLGKLGVKGIEGAPRLRHLLCERSSGTQDSALEVKILRLLRNARIPLPETNVAITDNQARHIATVDFAWLAQGVILQAHGYAWHSSRAAFEKDHRQSSRLTAFGWRVLEVTAKRLEAEPHTIVEELRQTLRHSQ